MYPRQAWLVSSLAYITCHLPTWSALSFFHLSLPSLFSGGFPNMTTIIVQWPQGPSPLLLRTQYHTVQERGGRSPETPQLRRGESGSLYTGVWRQLLALLPSGHGTSHRYSWNLCVFLSLPTRAAGRMEMSYLK